MQKITASIVIYNHSPEQIYKVINGLLGNVIQVKIYLIDNSDKSSRNDYIDNDNLVYIFNNANLGYGKAHNIALRNVIDNAGYHIILNPDIELTHDALLACIDYMNKQRNIGLLMPKILYPNGEVQYLCKQMPSPFDLIMRRFIPHFIKPMFDKRLDAYELKHKDYDQIMEIPNLSGCFMFIRCDALKTVGLFDEKFFMYLEDTDLSRRINSQYKTVYYPKVSIIHHYEKGSYKNYRLLRYHIQSAFYYFNKWGWMLDSTRATINNILN